jgi:hypothetical protein
MATNNALNVQGPTPLFYAYNDANQSIASGGSPVTVSFNSELYDLTSSFDTAGTYTFTAPVSGYYSFNINLLVTTGGKSENYCRLVTTAATYDVSKLTCAESAMGTDYATMSGTIQCYMAATDTCYVQMGTTSGSPSLTTVANNNQPSFSGILLFKV